MVAAERPASYAEALAEPRTIALANPGANANATLQVPGAVVWRPVSIVFTLTTDATVANRTVTVEYRNDALVWAASGAGLLVTASTTNQRFDGSVSRGLAEWTTGSDILFPLADALLTDEDSIVVAIGNRQAGDTLTTIALRVEQWPLGGYR